MPKWIEYYSEGTEKFFYDSANISKGKYIQVNDLIQWNKKDKAVRFDSKMNVIAEDVSTVIGSDIDCRNQTFKTLWFQDYNGTMGTGMKLAYRISNQDWAEIVSPKTHKRIEVLAKIVCK
jgi:hypothetical protein